jgi:Peptidase M16C associated
MCDVMLAYSKINVHAYYARYVCTHYRLEASIVGSGHSYASTRIDARYTLESYLGEISNGVSYIRSVATLISLISTLNTLVLLW